MKPSTPGSDQCNKPQTILAARKGGIVGSNEASGRIIARDAFSRVKLILTLTGPELDSSENHCRMITTDNQQKSGTVTGIHDNKFTIRFAREKRVMDCWKRCETN